MLRIDARHRLAGDRVAWRPTPNVGGALAPRFLVFHYTAGSSAASAIESLCTRKPSGNASAHLVVARDGTITQLAPFNVVTWHAGVSQWQGVVGLNQASIGIEIDNAGVLTAVGDRCLAWFGREVPRREVMLAAHKQGGPVRPWQAYTAVQIERCAELAELLVARYGLEDVIGHDDIAPGRKLDPGPAFPLASIASRALGRADDTLPRFIVTAPTLAIRRGPGVGYDEVAPQLPRGSIVRLVEPGARWSLVEVERAPQVEGYVSNAHLVRVPGRAMPRPAAKVAQKKIAQRAAKSAAKSTAKPAARKSAKAAAKKTARKTTAAR